MVLIVGVCYRCSMWFAVVVDDYSGIGSALMIMLCFEGCYVEVEVDGFEFI